MNVADSFALLLPELLGHHRYKDIFLELFVSKLFFLYAAENTYEVAVSLDLVIFIPFLLHKNIIWKQSRITKNLANNLGIWCKASE